MRQQQFSFTITDAAIFLRKSPVTLRGWEKQGLVRFERLGDDRRLSCNDMRLLAERAMVLGRITEDRRRLIDASLTLLEMVE